MHAHIDVTTTPPSSSPPQQQQPVRPYYHSDDDDDCTSSTVQSVQYRTFPLGPNPDKSQVTSLLPHLPPQP